MMNENAFVECWLLVARVAGLTPTGIARAVLRLLGREYRSSVAGATQKMKSSTNSPCNQQ